MKFRLFGVRFHISVPFCAMVAFLLFVDKTGMMAVALFATAIHEAGHIIMMLALHELPSEISLYPSRIKIVKKPAPLGYKNELLIAAAGPFFNLIACASCLILYRFVLPKAPLVQFGAVNLVLLVFQILPITGLDGGDILKCLLIKAFTLKTATVICVISSAVLIVMAIVAGGYIFYKQRSNPTLLLTSLYLAALQVIKVTSKKQTIES